MKVDALKFVDELKAAGASEELAKTHVRHLQEVIDSNLATKYDLELVKAELKKDIAESHNKSLVILVSVITVATTVLAFFIKSS